MSLPLSMHINFVPNFLQRCLHKLGHHIPSPSPNIVEFILIADLALEDELDARILVITSPDRVDISETVVRLQDLFERTALSSSVVISG